MAQMPRSTNSRQGIGLIDLALIEPVGVWAQKESVIDPSMANIELANAYNELGKELSSSKICVVGNYTLERVIVEGMSFLWSCVMFFNHTGQLGAYGMVRLGTHWPTHINPGSHQADSDSHVRIPNMKDPSPSPRCTKLSLPSHTYGLSPGYVVGASSLTT